MVSIHAPLRGATGPIRWLGLGRRGFNPRTPAGCDHSTVNRDIMKPNVSIHAPLRGATVAAGADGRLRGVSIHAPLRGATTNTQSSILATEGFQSTHPCGVRPSQPQESQGFLSGFNPRTPAGCDAALRDAARVLRSFNPRTPAGCDKPPPHRTNVRQWGFNPRTPAGCDAMVWLIMRTPFQFQSTHPCGVRRLIRI